MKSSIIYAKFLVLVWLLSGCGTKSYTWETVTMSSPTKSGQEFVLSQESLAVLPVLTPNRLQGYGIGLSQALNKTFAECFSDLHVIPTDESISEISRAGVEKAFNQMGHDWKSYTVHNRQGLESMGLALGVRYMLLPTLAEYEFLLRDRFVFLGFRAVQTRTESIKLALQLWDVQSGEILWESFGEGIITRDVFEEGAGSTGKLAMFLWRSMIEDLLERKTSSYNWNVEIYSRPCPLPEK